MKVKKLEHTVIVETLINTLLVKLFSKSLTVLTPISRCIQLLVQCCRDIQSIIILCFSLFLVTAHLRNSDAAPPAPSDLTIRSLHVLVSLLSEPLEIARN